TNPVHVAVALKYEVENMEAPVLIAKGAGDTAKRIVEIARENDVPVVRNPPVARMIYETTEIGDEIPESLYRAVAEIIAYVYTLKGVKV
ncbi:MAG: EscU/YscU/HrcU family type III secretion system export apparatus switch protein, partial [Thermotogae bacterium]|nr:EscU/YscU/HrcU family type III secretion system export apparatus switch protein [Thermotogota bacterium]